MRHEIALDTRFPYRVKFESRMFALKTQRYAGPVSVILDTGCVNTLIPIKYAEVYGKNLNRIRQVHLFGQVFNAKVYSIRKCKFGTLEIEYVTMLADNFGYDLKDTVLLGMNTINNWLPVPDRTENKLFVEEKFPPQIPCAKFPYSNYFNINLEYEMLETIDFSFI